MEGNTLGKGGFSEDSGKDACSKTDLLYAYAEKRSAISKLE